LDCGIAVRMLGSKEKITLRSKKRCSVLVRQEKQGTIGEKKRQRKF